MTMTTVLGFYDFQVVVVTRNDKQRKSFVLVQVRATDERNVTVMVAWRAICGFVLVCGLIFCFPALIFVALI
jgi:hypothetical protein